MNNAKAIDLMRSCGAIKEGHFVLTPKENNPWPHSSYFISIDDITKQPHIAQYFYYAMAMPWKDETTIVVGPAVAGIALAHGIAHVLNIEPG